VRLDQETRTKGSKIMALPAVRMTGRTARRSGVVARGRYFQAALEALLSASVTLPEGKGAAMTFYDQLGDFAELVAALSNLGARLAGEGIEKIAFNPAAEDVLRELPGQLWVAVRAAAEVQAIISAVHAEDFQRIERGSARDAAWNV
jgi:hypothetical protein